MDALIAFWGYTLAAAMFASLLLWRVIEQSRQPGQRLMLAALAMMTCWAWLAGIDPGSALADYAETARNLVWIGLLHALSAASDERQRGVRLVYGAVAGVIGLKFLATFFLGLGPNAALAQTAVLLRLTTAAGALVLVHNLYGQAAPGTRSHIRFAMLGLAGMWIYDLNYYTVMCLGAGGAQRLVEWRGVAMILTVPLFALALRQDEGWRIRLSRAASFQSISLLAICGYFALMAILATALRGSQFDWLAALMIAALAVMTIALFVVLPSRRARAWLRVKLSKHLFEHRYDYRTEWLRFAETLGHAGREAAPLEQRIVKAFADIAEAPGGLLLTGDHGSGLAVAADWNWPGASLTPAALGEALPLWTAVEEDQRIVEFDGLREGWGEARDRLLPVPPALLDDVRLWVGIPLAHHDRMLGFVLLATPDVSRALDWEDFDLLRTAGRQAANALAEAQGQEALAHARRFEEFNRRFAFILHDIKNLVSQLSLVARNAERHADNPEFRADMVATLKSSVGKMNDLLARLAPAAETRVEPSRPHPLQPILAAAITTHGVNHPVELDGDTGAFAECDATALEQALSHLLHNACDASPASAPVIVRVERREETVAISVIDRGPGMDTAFIRSRLFEPFASTKDNGFGIGAFEARALIQAMGGRLDVDSRPGAGSRFTITLPAADAAAKSERKRA